MHTETAPDWAFLPPEILQLIARKLCEIFDYIRFRSVCTSWRRAALPTELPPQLPWLAVTSGKDEFIDTISFFHLSNHHRPIHSINLESTDREFIGSSHGWVVIVQRHEITLLNPITKAQILLQRTPNGKDCIQPFLGAVLCSHPVLVQPGQILIAIFTYKRLAFLRHGDNAWTMISISSPRDIKYCNDQLYLVNNLGGIAVLECPSSVLHQLIRQPPLEEQEVKHKILYPRRLVEASGDLLLLTWYDHHFNDSPHYRILHVFKIERGEIGELKHSRMGSIRIPSPWSEWTVQFVWGHRLPKCRGYRIYLAHTYVGEPLETFAVLKIIDTINGAVSIVDHPYFQIEVGSIWDPTDVFLMTPSLY